MRQASLQRSLRAHWVVRKQRTGEQVHGLLFLLSVGTSFRTSAGGIWADTYSMLVRDLLTEMALAMAFTPIISLYGYSPVR